MFKDFKAILRYDKNYHQPNDIYLPFAENNALLKSITEFNNMPLLNFWTMDDTVILGMSDQRLSHLDSGLDFLKKNNYKYFVRNSGGLAVVNDRDVLNVSLFLPREVFNLSINEAYELMVKIITDTFSKTPITVKEIPNSYCPGDYDLSINGQKFAGISQRRNSKGIVVMAYIGISGNQDTRSQLIKDFYNIANLPKKQKSTFPDVDLKVMANLDELLGISLTVDYVKELIISHLNSKIDTTTVTDYMKTSTYQSLVNDSLNDLKRRNSKIIK